MYYEIKQSSRRSEGLSMLYVFKISGGNILIHTKDHSIKGKISISQYSIYVKISNPLAYVKSVAWCPFSKQNLNRYCKIGKTCDSMWVLIYGTVGQKKICNTLSEYGSTEWPNSWALRAPNRNEDWYAFKVSLVNISWYILIFPCSLVKNLIQKQPFRGILRKSCSENIQPIYWRTPMPKYNFNKVVEQLYWNHSLAWVFYCNFAAYFQNNLRTPLKGSFCWYIWYVIFRFEIKNEFCRSNATEEILYDLLCYMT